MLAAPPHFLSSFFFFLLILLCIKKSLVYSEGKKDVHHFPFHADVDTITEEEERQLRDETEFLLLI